MEFIVSSTELLQHLNAVKGVINSKNTLPILDNYLFNLDGNTLSITASDLETTLNTQISLSNANGSGLIAIEAKRLTDILKEFSEQPLTFKINESNYQVDIITQNGKFSIPCQSGVEYPKLPIIDEANITSVTLPSEIFLKGINCTIFATSDDELRPVMTGILIEFKKEHFRMVSTDSHKLVRYTRTDIIPSKEDAVILPKKSATILKNILAKNQGEVTLEFDKKNIYITLPNFKLVCRLIEGRYPAYNAVIPVDNPNKLVVDRYDLYNTIKRVSICASQASNLTKLSLKANQATISAQDIDFQASAYEVLNCQYAGVDMEIGFKSGFLLDILSNTNSTEINFEMSDPTRAGIISPVQNEDEHEDILMLAMPMMV